MELAEASEEQIAALRERIRAAGGATRSYRLATAGCMFFPFALLAFFIGAIFEDEFGVDGLLAAVATVGIGLFLSVPLAALHRWRRRVRLQEQAALLPQEQLAVVLLPLRDEPLGDTRRIVETLLRSLSVPAEVSPSDAPAGRGSRGG